MTDGWTVSTNQSSGIKSSDLQVAKATGTSPVFSMAHKMGLLKLDMTSGKSVPTTATWTYNQTDGSYVESGTQASDPHTTIYPYHTFNTTTDSGYGVPLNATTANTDCYFIVKSTSTTENTSIKFGCNTQDTKEYWTDVTVSNIGYGKYLSKTITSDRKFANLIALFSCVKTYQTISLPWYGSYKMECWGASGGKDIDTTPGSGGYVSGTITMSKINLYVYIGNQGLGVTKNADNTYNGYTLSWFIEQQSGINWGGLSTGGAQGGGSTDIRLLNGDWKNSSSLQTRIIVAGGGGGTENGGDTADSGLRKGGAAGGLRGYSSQTAGGTQTSGYGFGVAEYVWDNMLYQNNTTTDGTDHVWGAGGNGYWSGYSCHSTKGGGGGSSFISGHPGCTTVSYNSKSYSFSSTKMIDGKGLKWTTANQTTGGSAEQMPKPGGSSYALNTGHTGDGYAKIMSQ